MWRILGKKVLLDLALLLIKDVLPKLAVKATSSALHKIERKIHALGAVRAGNRFTLIITAEYMDDIIKIVEPLEESGLFIHGDTEELNHEIKKQEVLLQPVTSNWKSYNCYKSYNWKRASRYFSSIINISLTDKIFGKMTRRAERGLKMHKSF